MNIPSATFFIVLITTLIGLYYYRTLHKPIYKAFVWFLVFSFGIELLGYICKHIYHIKDFSVYNIYAIVTLFYYLFFYNAILKKPTNKKLTFVFISLFALFVATQILVFNYNVFTDFLVNTIVFATILIVTTLILFLVEIINDSHIIIHLKKSLLFWISVGTLLFCIGVIPIVISASFLHFDGLFDHILTGLNGIRYGCFCYGFILFEKKYN